MGRDEPRDGETRQAWPLSAHLVVLCLAVLLPGILLGGIALSMMLAAERAATEVQILQVAQEMSADVDREILGYARVGEALAVSPLLQAGEFAAFALQVRQGPGLSGWGVIVTDAAGKLVVNTSPAADTQLPRQQLMKDVSAVIASGKPHISDLRIDDGSRIALVGVWVPVVSGAHITHALFLGVRVNVLGALLESRMEQAHWQAAISDGGGRIIALAHDRPGSIGEPTSPSRAAQIERNEPIAHGTSQAGTRVVRAIHRSKMTGWTVSASVPSAALARTTRVGWITFAALGLGLTALSVTLAYLFARRIAQPIHHLARIPHQAGSGSFPETALREANDVGAALVSSIREMETGKERLRLALAAAGAGAWEYDFARRRSEWSPEMFQIYGLAHGDRPPRREQLWGELLHPEDRERIRSAATAQIRRGGSFNVEFRIMRPDGSIAWISSRGMLKLGPDGRPLVARGIDQDVTAGHLAQSEQKRLLRTTAQQLNELQSVYNSAPIGLALLDRELRFVRINRVLADINGFTVAEHLGRYVFDVVPGLKAAGEPLLRQVLETGQPITGVELSGQTAAQPGVQRAWLEQFYPVKAHDGTVYGIGLICEEVTGKARAQFEQAHLAAIIEAATDAIISTSADARIRSWNPAAEQMFGYTAAEAIGSPASLLVPRESGEPLCGIFEQVMTGEKIRRETVRRRKDGVLIPVSLSASPMRDETGRIVATTVMFRDISEQKRREEHTRFLMRELSHRSKNLLAVIQAMARQTARSSQDLDDFQRRFTARVMGLAQSHDLLVKEDWRGAPVGELIRAQLAPFIDPDDGRLKLSGPHLLLRPEAAQNIGLALHELATNASKHGALSIPSGRIAIQWELAYHRPDDARFRMTWQESGGPPVNVPATHGFGHTVVEAMVGRALDGEAHIDWVEKGLTWRLDVPATCVASGPASDLESAKQD